MKEGATMTKIILVFNFCIPFLKEKDLKGIISGARLCMCVCVFVSGSYLLTKSSCKRASYLSGLNLGKTKVKKMTAKYSSVLVLRLF